MRWPTHLLTLDYETYWATDYTLSKSSTESYVRDPRFKAHGAAVKYVGQPSRWITAKDLPAFFASVPWDDTALLCQHAQFDGLILEHHYKVSPALYLDTLSMARMILPRQKHSLAQLADHFGLPPKGQAVNLSKGLIELPPHIEQQLGVYSCHDADLTYDIFRRFIGAVPHQELVNIDTTIRMFTTPRLELDVPKARSLLAKVIWGKRTALRRLGVTKTQLASGQQFAELLESRFGIACDMKEGKGQLIPALAKTDPFMKSLLEHPHPDVQALAGLRLKVKSTLEETRLRRMLDMSVRGKLSVYYKFAGAHTLRWAGGDNMNWQNLPRGSELRKCIRAPEGHVIVVQDSSQIEARMLNCLAEQWDVLAEFEKGDPYATMATSIYERLITKQENPGERHVGKVLELGCGYGMGSKRLRETLRIGALGGEPVLINLETAERYVQLYRMRHPKVVDYWAQGELALQHLHAKHEKFPWGPMVLDKGYVLLPNGTSLDYTGLAREDGEWRLYDRAGHLIKNHLGYPIRLWGGMMVENVDQALSRVVIAQAMARLREEAPQWPIVLTSHDELACLAPIAEAPACKAFMHEVMVQRLPWLPSLPLAAEGGYDVSYSK